MPLYEYACEACGNRFERIQKFSDPHVELCPNCGELKVRKLLSSPAIQFKGSGFYINDYARKGAGTPEGAKTDEAPKASPQDGKGTASDSSGGASGGGTSGSGTSSSGASTSGNTSSASAPASTAPSTPSSKDN